MKKMETNSLKMKFILSIGIITVSVLIVASIIMFMVSMNSFWNSTEKSLEQSLQIGQVQTSEWFLDKELLLTTIAEDMRLFEISQKDEIENYFSHYINKYDYMISVYIGTPDNRLYSGDFWVPDAGYNVLTREWYIKAKETGKIYYTPPYIDATSGKMIISLSMPASDKSGAYLGVVAMDITLDVLVDYISNEKILDTTGKAFLLDSSDNFIVHENDEFLPKISGENEIYINFNDSGIKAERKQNEQGFSLEKDKDYDRQKKYIATIAIPQNGWTYGFSVPISDFYPEFYGLILKLCAISLLLVVLAIWTSYYITKRMITPIYGIIDAAGKLATGDVNVRVDVHTGDELETLSNQFNLMVASTLDQIEAMQRLADGDLTATILPKSLEDILSITINKVTEDLRNLIGDIHSAATLVDASSGQVAEGAQTLAEGAAEQASSIGELSISVSSVSEKVNKNAEHAKQAAEYAQFTVSKVEESTEKMQEMLSAMEEMNKAAQEIRSIIAVINEIAEQTNLLALNAAIEAAHAGNAGRGFAVVADAVRKLAGQSTEAVKQTTTLIEVSVEAVSKGLRIAEDTAMALEDVSEKTEQVKTVIKGIEEASQEQAVAITQINHGIDQICAIVQTNAAAVQESSASSEELYAQAAMLYKEIDKFKLTKQEEINK